MRILLISSNFPPYAWGGAEISAYNFAKWLRDHGHEVGVFMASSSKEKEIDGEIVEGMKLWSFCLPRPYSMSQHRGGKPWQKPIWHIQDHVDPRNKGFLRRVLDAFKPDVCQIHLLQGIGYNALSELGNIPTQFFLHDLALACFRTAMFKGGSECKSHCLPCQISTQLKRSYLKQVKNLTFAAPSKAVLEKVREYFPLKSDKCSVSLNANLYPKPTVEWAKSEQTRFLYVGRLDATKGILVLLEAAEQLAKTHSFTLKLLGKGALEDQIKHRFGKYDWLHCFGHVPLEAVSNHMSESDILCTPSLWIENSPGVIVHALSQGLPVFASDQGGIYELIHDNRNGKLLPPGDVVGWRNAMAAAIDDPKQLEEWHLYAKSQMQKYDPEELGQKIFDSLKSMVAAD